MKENKGGSSPQVELTEAIAIGDPRGTLFTPHAGT